ncbi:type 1 glutamine amidotransferase domain-containing protein [Acinetobacter oleivorans]|uniref:type 1 glutamine amidotransferase domain-containing protein n=1 Tax=Acinetobacter oleivorans TaxID=1148157 RepID=UPI001CD4E594|nr:type 1 glutamine amidotransferase domain-containing protein [Acinetobacter oleivorans]
MNILMILTSHDQLGNTGHKTGFWLEEFTAPYYVFKDSGADITLASPLGGQPPLDPKSNEADFQTETTRRFEQDETSKAQLAQTKKISEINVAEFDAVFFPGGHGPLWDLVNDQHAIALLEQVITDQKPLGVVCHASAVVKNVKTSEGKPFAQGKKITGFSNSEEAAVQLTDIVPFLLEDELKGQGAHYVKGADWQSFVVKDGLFVSGQNPASSEAVARELLKLLK